MCCGIGFLSLPLYHKMKYMNIEVTKQVKLVIDTECQILNDEIIEYDDNQYSTYRERVNFNDLILKQDLPSGVYKVSITLEKVDR